MCIKVFMKRLRVARISRIGIHRPESPSERVHKTRAEVVEAEGFGELFAAVTVAVGGGAGVGEEFAEGVVFVGVGDGAGRAGEETGAAVAVVAEVDQLPRVAGLGGDVLADEVVAEEVDAG